MSAAEAAVDACGANDCALPSIQGSLHCARIEAAGGEWLMMARRRGQLHPATLLMFVRPQRTDLLLKKEVDGAVALPP